MTIKTGPGITKVNADILNDQIILAEVMAEVQVSISKTTAHWDPHIVML